MGGWSRSSAHPARDLRQQASCDIAAQLNEASGVGEGAVRRLLRLYRVRDWLHFLPLPLATFDREAPSVSALFAAGRGVATAFALLAFGYLLNSVFDRHVDLDPRKNPLILHGARDARASLVAMFALSLVLAVLGPWPVQLATVLCLICYMIYSAGPRLKSIPLVGSLINIGLFTPLLFIGMRDASLPTGFVAVMVVCSALVLETQLIHEAADQADDRAGGVRTTWLILGPRWTALIAALAGLTIAVASAGMVSAARSTAVAAIVTLIFAVTFPLLLAWHGGDPNRAARLRLAHRWCGVLLGAGLFAVWRWGN
jgi:4-hydroxybenzoate polyprenyltransferase